MSDLTDRLRATDISICVAAADRIDGLERNNSALMAQTHRDLTRIEHLERELAACRAFERSVNEALNSGDGSYRP